MPSLAFKKALSRDLPVVFVNIGWAIRYDGTETIRGGHKHIKENPGKSVGESRAFIARNDGRCQCGVGIGQAPEPIHIVLVARDPGDRILKVVGIYAAAGITGEKANWAVARTQFAERLPANRRYPVIGWPAGQGMRRWAKRNGAPEHQSLLTLFARIAEDLGRGEPPRVGIGAAGDEDGYEGELKTLLVRHRKREHKLRIRKITKVMRENDGRVICEVPRCGFDFQARYGELGFGFAEVHHKKPLSESSHAGQKVQLSDLAVVCANCHRMIHHNGQCRPLDDLIPTA
jgi:hypothetical protein